jgi:hypothetical protein
MIILRELLEPSRRAQSFLEEVKEKLPGTASESIELRGFFVLMVSAVETMLTDTYVYYLKSFPEAFDFKDARFGKDDILEANLALDLIEQQVEKNAISQAYESFPELLKTFTKTLGITTPVLDPDLIDRIVEVKETRNLLLHNNLRVNRRYIARAGRSRREGNKLSLGQEYVSEACDNLTSLNKELDARMSAKYASYTRLAALRRLWEYLFSSPIMPFDDFWITDEEKDKVKALKVSRWEEHLSSSEHAFLAIWRAHFNGWRKPSGDAPSWRMYGLDDHNKQKMLWFLATLADFDVR